MEVYADWESGDYDPSDLCQGLIRCWKLSGLDIFLCKAYSPETKTGWTIVDTCECVCFGNNLTYIRAEESEPDIVVLRKDEYKECLIFNPDKPDVIIDGGYFTFPTKKSKGCDKKESFGSESILKVKSLEILVCLFRPLFCHRSLVEYGAIPRRAYESCLHASALTDLADVPDLDWRLRILGHVHGLVNYLYTV